LIAVGISQAKVLLKARNLCSISFGFLKIIIGFFSYSKKLYFYL